MIRGARSARSGRDHEGLDAVRPDAAEHQAVTRAAAWHQLGRALPADGLTLAGLSELAPVMHKETAGTSELVSLPRDHPERQFLIGQIRPGQLKRLRNIIRIDIDRCG